MKAIAYMTTDPDEDNQPLMDIELVPETDEDKKLLEDGYASYTVKVTCEHWRERWANEHND